MRKTRASPPNCSTAVEMAASAGVDRKLFRRHLRAARLPWHSLNDPWTVIIDSPEYDDMRRVLATLTRN